MGRDARRLSLILLLAPFVLWIVLLIALPQLGIAWLSLREKLGPGEYSVGLGNYADFLAEPIYWNTLLRTAMFLMLTLCAVMAPAKRTM